MVVKVRTVITSATYGGGTDQEGAQGTFWDHGNVLLPCLGGCYKAYTHVKTSMSCLLKTHVLSRVDAIPE